MRVGLIPSEDSRAMLAASKQLLEMLEKNLGIKVQGFVASDYNGVIEALRANHLEVAYLGPFSYVLGTTIAPIEAFAHGRDREVRPHLLSQPDHHAKSTAASRRSRISRAARSRLSIRLRPRATCSRRPA